MSPPSAKRQLVLSAACLAAVLLGASCTEPETQGMTEAETQIASELQAVKAELDAMPDFDPTRLPYALRR